MNDDSPPTAAATPPVTDEELARRVALLYRRGARTTRALLATGAALLGVAGLGAAGGFVLASGYFQAAGATWVVPMLSPAELLTFNPLLLVLPAIVSFALYLLFLYGEYRGSPWLRGAGVLPGAYLFGYGLSGLPSLLVASGLEQHAIPATFMAGAFLCLIAALEFVELTRGRVVLRGLNLLGIAAAWACALFVAGRTQAALDMSPSSRLAWAALADGTQYRLVTTIGGQRALVAHIGSATRDAEFRVVMLEDVIRVTRHQLVGADHEPDHPPPAPAPGEPAGPPG